MFVEDIFPPLGAKPLFMRELRIAYANKADCLRKLFRIQFFPDLFAYGTGILVLRNHGPLIARVER
jgi:hypothetical protein